MRRACAGTARPRAESSSTSPPTRRWPRTLAHEARERLERERLAHARGAEEHEHARVERELGLDGEGAIAVAHRDGEPRFEGGRALMARADRGPRRAAAATTRTESAVSTAT